MAHMLASARREWRTILLVLAGAAVQLFLVTRSLDFLIQYVIPDDAFYYFGIARHIAAGSGSTFDGVNLTNGYHPLWLLVLIPIFNYFSEGGIADLAPIHAALVFSVVVNIATALVVTRILARFSESKNIRAFGLFILIFNPFLLYETINGLETSLSLFFFALFFLLALRLEEGGHSSYALLGFVGGLMALARLDLAIYVVAFLGWIVLTRKDGWKRALISVCFAALVVSPWILWNIAMFGTPFTSSSEASTIVNHQLIVQDHGESWFQTFKAVVYNTQYELDQLIARTGMYAIACAVLGAALALAVLGLVRIPRQLALLTVMQTLALGFALLFFANAGIRWTVRSWYFVSFNLFLAILAVSVLAVLFSRISRKRTAGVFLTAAVIFSFGVDWSKSLRHGMPQQRDMYAAALWMNDNLSEGSVVGVFNAGIEGYFSRHTLVNLDGLVNNAALDAIKRHDVWTYIEDAKIGYIADFPLYLTYRYKSFLPEDALGRLDLAHRMGEAESDLSIWRVK